MTFPPRRRSYRGLIRKPAWGLYRGERLFATVRADSKEEALELFAQEGLVQPFDVIREIK